MKNHIVVLLLLVNFLLGFVPFNSQLGTTFNNVENQLEDVLISETYINNPYKVNTRIKQIKLFPVNFVKIHSTFTYYFNFKTLKNLPNTVKSGRQVLFKSFLK